MAEIIIQKHWAWYQCLVNLPFVEQAVAVLLELHANSNPAPPTV